MLQAITTIDNKINHISVSSSTLNQTTIFKEARRFPDTEGYVRVPDDCIEPVRSGPVALVSATFPDSAILETLFLLHALWLFTNHN